MKKVLVTGATGGMGAAICKKLIKEGYKVYGLDYRKCEEIDGLKFFSCDVTDSEAIEKALEEIKKDAEKLDAIVHTAGVYDLDSLLEMDEKRFKRIFDINLFGVYRINKAFVPLLEKGGRIVITSSELAPLDPLPFTGVYGITKGALEKYAFSLRMETNLLGISVSIIRPGAVKTGLLNVSTDALERFVENTNLYKCNAKRFKGIVDSVEAKNVPAEVIGETVYTALTDKTPKYVYNVNRNPLLKILNTLPDRMQVSIIGLILKN